MPEIMEFESKNNNLSDQFKSLQISSQEEEEFDVDVDVDNEEEEEEEGEEEEEEPITLGFVERPKNPQILSCHFFPSKAGGVSVSSNSRHGWIPVNLPSGNHCRCGICGEPLQFLIQLPRDNPFYSSEPPRLDETSALSRAGAPLCCWCGTWKGEKVCGSCRKARYCSEQHQVMHWRSGHKIDCQQRGFASEHASSNCSSMKTSLAINKVASTALWPEFEIVIDDESAYDTEVPEDDGHATSLISYGQMSEVVPSLLDKFEGTDDSKAWASFQERIARAPEQVLRYCRGLKAKPLWPSFSNRPSKSDIPKCNYCDGSLCFEFQVLPQLLYYFGVKNDADALDWATIAVYTCTASCDKFLGYKEEFAWVQLSS